LTSLPASLGYSYAHLAPANQRLLAAVCLFHGTVDTHVLANFSTVDGVPERFRGVTEPAWAAALDVAAEAGLLTDVGAGMYRIHPALPAFLAAAWRGEDPAGYEPQRAVATRALLTAYAIFGVWLLQQISSGDSELANTVIGLQQGTMGYLLGYALEGKHWAEAGGIAGQLCLYLEAQGRYAEVDAWTDRVRLATEGPSGSPPSLDSLPGGLWLGFTGSQAASQMSRGRLDEAEQTYRDILAMLHAQPKSPLRQSRLAVSYHQLGMIARELGRLEKAQDWHTRSLAIEEDLGNRSGIAGSCHELGTVSLRRGRLEEAQAWYTRSLAIKEELGDRSGIASSYHQLGRVAQERGRLEQARDWYTRSLAIMEEVGDRRGIASCCHQLGIVAADRGRLEEAQAWYTRSLAIKEEIGDRSGIASSYHELGRVAIMRDKFEEARDWYTRSLAISEKIGDRPAMAATYAQLSALTEIQGNHRQALKWAVRCVALFGEVPHPATGHAPELLAVLTHQLGTSALEACWQQVTGDPLPDRVRDYVRSYRPDPGDASGGTGR
jgi:tetratricopeptide (TPR) repeat protein